MVLTRDKAVRFIRQSCSGEGRRTWPTRYSCRKSAKMSAVWMHQAGQQRDKKERALLYDSFPLPAVPAPPLLGRDVLRAQYSLPVAV